jgi:hypothetical protein
VGTRHSTQISCAWRAKTCFVLPVTIPFTRLDRGPSLILRVVDRRPYPACYRQFMYRGWDHRAGLSVSVADGRLVVSLMGSELEGARNCLRPSRWPPPAPPPRPRWPPALPRLLSVCSTAQTTRAGSRSRSAAIVVVDRPHKRHPRSAALYCSPRRNF